MSIEALNWARKIFVGDPYGKSVLRAIADYADENGYAFPSLSRLADDCDLSVDSVRRRIKLLEEIGIIVTFRCWMDEHGKRNSDGRGRETSRDIRLPLDLVRTRETADPDGVDAAEEGVPLANSHPPLASGEGGQQLGRPSSRARGGVALGPPPNELPSNKEDTPKSPQGGVEAENEISEEVKRRFDYFLINCLGYRTQDAGRPLAMFTVLSEAEQIACAAASPLHAAELTKAKKKSLDAWKLIRERFWIRYPEARLPERAHDPVWVDEGPDIDALRVLARIGDLTAPRLVHDEVKGPGLMRRLPVLDDLRALAHFAGDDLLDWFIAEPDTREYNAWRHRVHDWTGAWIEARIVMRRGTHVLNLPSGPTEAQNRQRGIPVPCRWPPKKDGTIYPDDESPDSSEGNAA